MKFSCFIPTKKALGMVDNLNEVVSNEFKKFCGLYDDYQDELFIELCKKIKEAESAKDNWDGFSIIKGFYINNDKIVLQGKVVKVQHKSTHYIDGKYVVDDDDNCLEFSIENEVG